MEQSEKRAKRDVANADGHNTYILPDHTGRNKTTYIKEDPDETVELKHDPLADDECDIGPVQVELYVDNEPIEMDNEDFHLMSQPTARLLKAHGPNCGGCKEFQESVRCDIDRLEKKLDKIMNAVCEQRVFLEQLVTKDALVHQFKCKFPLRSHEEMRLINLEVKNGEKFSYIRAMKSLLQPGGIVKQMRNIIADDLATEYNVDGVHGKMSFKSHYPHFYEALLKSADDSNAEDNVRKALHLQKKRASKKKSIRNRNTN